jgi:hypothetical protein
MRTTARLATTVSALVVAAAIGGATAIPSQARSDEGPAITAMSAAADEPATEPGAKYVYFSWNKTVSCETGYVCASVPLTWGYRIFKFYYGGTYKLYDWQGTGSMANNQTGGWSVRLYDANKHQIKCRNRTGWGDVNWDPAYYLRLSTYPC